jgi:hypothetical protein
MRAMLRGWVQMSPLYGCMAHRDEFTPGANDARLHHDAAARLERELSW